MLGSDRHQEGVRSSQGTGAGQGRPREMSPPGEQRLTYPLPQDAAEGVQTSMYPPVLHVLSSLHLTHP